jgi:hypothetical protein
MYDQMNRPSGRNWITFFEPISSYLVLQSLYPTNFLISRPRQSSQLPFQAVKGSTDHYSAGMLLVQHLGLLKSRTLYC